MTRKEYETSDHFMSCLQNYLDDKFFVEALVSKHTKLQFESHSPRPLPST